MDPLNVIRSMEQDGYPAAAILTVIRAKLEAEERQADAYWTEDESRRRLAVLAQFGETQDPFAA